MKSFCKAGPLSEFNSEHESHLFCKNQSLNTEKDKTMENHTMINPDPYIILECVVVQKVQKEWQLFVQNPTETSHVKTQCTF